MEKLSQAKPKKKGFFALLKDSMTKTSEGCGPDCGCHVQEKKEEPKDEEEAGETGKKAGKKSDEK